MNINLNVFEMFFFFSSKCEQSIRVFVIPFSRGVLINHIMRLILVNSKNWNTLIFMDKGRYKFNSVSSHIVHRNDFWLGSFICNSIHFWALSNIYTLQNVDVVLLYIRFSLIDSNIMFSSAQHQCVSPVYIWGYFIGGVRVRFMYFVISIMLRMCELINGTI